MSYSSTFIPHQPQASCFQPSYTFPVNFMYLCIREKIGLLISCLQEVGKSGHHRAAKRITSVTREGRTSATESRYSSAVVKPGKLFAVQW